VDHPKANANNAAVMPLLIWKKENALIVSHVGQLVRMVKMDAVTGPAGLRVQK